MESNQKRLPIKVVAPSKDDYQRPDSSGGPKKTFADVTPSIRESFAQQVDWVDQYFQTSFKRNPRLPAVARVTLKEKALAKSHRPTNLLDSNTCPIIGVQGFGQLLVSVRPEGLQSLRRKFLTDDTKGVTANISTIERIEPYRLEDALQVSADGALDDLLDRAKASLKFKLFRHGDSRADHELLMEFLRTLHDLKLPEPTALNYGGDLYIFRLEGIHRAALQELGRFVGTQSLSEFPTYYPLRTASTPIRQMRPDEFPQPEADRNYPTIGLIDSGTDPNNPFLQSWVVARHDFIPPSLQVNDHGSFVAGLLINARGLNHGDPRFPEGSAKIVDVVALSPNERTTEDQLVAILDEVVPQHPEVRVWNLSLGSSRTAADFQFSDLAVKLDTMQTDHGVQFVFAAGNLSPQELCGWPRPPKGEIDRLAVPADSARGIAVGALAHTRQHNSLVGAEEPSPFTRRGPGAMYLPKPELVHYGGNCAKGGQYTQTGIVSINHQGSIAEDIGTSFSTPLVSSILANVDMAMTKRPTTNLMKALTIHSAVLGTDKHTKEEFQYRGFGTPGDALTVLTCADWAATLIFEISLMPGLEFVKYPFPIPKCLRKATGEVVGEIAMTLVYDPPLDAAFGAEYCRRNVEVSLGTFDFDIKENKRVHDGQVHLSPKGLTKLYEKAVVENGFKWSPVKVYRRAMPKGVTGDQWRLKVSAHNRSGFDDRTPQDIALIITLLDPEKKAPVYNDLVTAMNALGWITQDLEIQARVRQAGSL